MLIPSIGNPDNIVRNTQGNKSNIYARDPLARHEP